jgi:hypothetical protein
VRVDTVNLADKVPHDYYRTAKLYHSYHCHICNKLGVNYFVRIYLNNRTPYSMYDAAFYVCSETCIHVICLLDPNTI